ncbi:MAG: GNAT family N-acetyltransferase [Chloroflexi bacterium]|nr:GNAT family N-acetyltransferase [Chloroflexota bacterium]
MQLTRYGSVDDFVAEAERYQVAREAEHNLLLGICSAIRADAEALWERPYFVIVTDDSGGIAAAALRTPPWDLVLSQIDDLAAIEPLVEDSTLHDAHIRGVTGPKIAADAFARRWSQWTGRGVHLELEERIMRLSRVVPPTPIPGSWRLAEDRDRALLGQWWSAFADEAVPEAPRWADLAAVVDRLIRRVDRTIYLWEVAGRVVSMAGAGGKTPNGIRIGPVYTPPELRRRGYASALTAAVSQDQLDAGRRFCFLFTNLANATSNRIYQAIGYEPVAAVDQYAFEAGPPL